MTGYRGGHGVAGRSGPPGNSNALRHGAYSKALTVPRGREWVSGLVRAHHRGLVEDLGGDGELTEAQRGLLRAAMICLKRALLIEAELTERGMGDAESDAKRNLLGRQPAFLRLYVDCLKLVGLERRAIDENDLDAVLRREAAARRLGGGA